jgi:hypothetical protein
MGASSSSEKSHGVQVVETEFLKLSLVDCEELLRRARNVTARGLLQCQQAAGAKRGGIFRTGTPSASLEALDTVAVPLFDVRARLSSPPTLLFFGVRSWVSCRAEASGLVESHGRGGGCWNTLRCVWSFVVKDWWKGEAEGTCWPLPRPLAPPLRFPRSP